MSTIDLTADLTAVVAAGRCDLPRIGAGPGAGSRSPAAVGWAA
ncbi:hypothetical protein OF117_18205 [Geodermatophilus sp. YIM 151500]|nr:hypothetical protein [Geodermatophilus sp. YIM 151500]MCV2491284.1 hypothetical protein [Geodermatophilus sp. YIM 151500]